MGIAPLMFVLVFVWLLRYWVFLLFVVLVCCLQCVCMTGPCGFVL